MTKKSKTNKKKSKLEITKDFADGTAAIRGVNHLCFGKIKIMLSDEEISLLENLYNEYLEANSVSVGFIHSLVGYMER